MHETFNKTIKIYNQKEQEYNSYYIDILDNLTATEFKKYNKLVNSFEKQLNSNINNDFFESIKNTIKKIVLLKKDIVNLLTAYKILTPLNQILFKKEIIDKNFITVFLFVFWRWVKEMFA